jgi:tetratricopeptide (TPR) repeat protein
MFVRPLLITAALTPLLLGASAVDDLNQGLVALDHGRIRDAHQLLSRAYDELQRADPPKPKELKSAAMALSSTYQFMGKPADAERVALPVVEEWRRTGDPGLLFAVQSLASLRAQQGQWEEALRLSKDAADCAEKKLGASHRVARVALGHLANLYLQAGLVDEADRALAKALSGARAEGAGDVELATVLINYAKTKIVKGDSVQAVQLAREALEVASRGQDQLMIQAESGYTLAAAYLYAGHPERSEPLVKAAIAKYDAAAGPNSPSVCGALMLAADVEFAKRKFSAAASYLARATENLRAAYGPVDLEVAIGEAKLAEVYVVMEKIPEAAQLLAHSVPVLERMFNRPSPRVAASYRDLGEIARVNGSTEQAEAYFRKAIAAFEAAHFQGRAYIDTLQRYGELLKKERRAEAREVLSRAKTMAHGLRPPSVGLGY